MRLYYIYIVYIFFVAHFLFAYVAEKLYFCLKIL